MVRWAGRLLVWLMVALIYFPLGYLALLSFSATPRNRAARRFFARHLP